MTIHTIYPMDCFVGCAFSQYPRESSWDYEMAPVCAALLCAASLFTDVLGVTRSK